MGGSSCPDCRGELVDDATHNRWIITLITPDSVASGLDPDEFSIDVDIGTNYHQDLASNSGTSSGGDTTYQWSISRPGTPTSGVINMLSDTLGALYQDLTIS